MRHDSAKLLEELENCADFKQFTQFLNNNANEIKRYAVAEKLGELIREKKLKKSEIIKKSGINEIYAYQIFSGSRVPERKKLLSIAFGMELTLEETQNLLKDVGYAPLYPKNPFDCILIYALCKRLDISRTNEILYDYSEDVLG